MKSARLHGTRGQEQFGVDAAAEILGGGKLAASCKCYEIASAGLILTACEEFDKHKKRWKEEDCRQFVVVVAGYADNPKVQQEETKQKARFRRKNISFELWDGTTVVQKLRRHPELVHQRQPLNFCRDPPMPPASGLQVLFDPLHSESRSPRELSRSIARPRGRSPRSAAVDYIPDTSQSLGRRRDPVGIESGRVLQRDIGIGKLLSGFASACLDAQGGR